MVSIAGRYSDATVQLDRSPTPATSLADRVADAVTRAGVHNPAVSLLQLDGVPYPVFVVRCGDSALPDERDIRARSRLTPRESQVALLLARGLSDKQIARTLGFKPACASRHGEKVRAKLGVSNRRHVRDALLGLNRPAATFAP